MTGSLTTVHQTGVITRSSVRDQERSIVKEGQVSPRQGFDHRSRRRYVEVS